MRKLQGVLVVGAVVLIVIFAWPESEESPTPKPVTETLLASIRAVLRNTQAVFAGALGNGVFANPFAAAGPPVVGGLLPNPVATGLRYDLKTIEGRQAYYDDLVRQKPGLIWAAWDEAISRADPDELGVLIPAMGYALRREGSPDLYKEMAQRLYQSNLSVQDRLYVVGAMEHAATPEAARVLLEYAQAVELGRVANGDSVANQQTLLQGTQQAVQLASKEFINGSRNWDISPALENAWLKLDKAEALSTRVTISQAIVYLGKPDGLSVLIDSVNKGGLPVDARNVALSSIAQLSSNDAVPVLGNKLNQASPNTNSTNSDLAEALAKGLVSVGSADAMKEIANYLGQPSVNQQSRENILLLLKKRNLPDEALKAIKPYLGK